MSCEGRENPSRWRVDPDKTSDSPDKHLLPTDGLNLVLRRYRRPGGKGTVLLIHGASANSDTFLIPNGGLMDYLRRRGWEVWTLDWRGSRDVVASLPPGRFLGGSLQAECALFSVDRVAAEDFRKALAFIDECHRTEAPGSPPKPKSVVAHCFGAGSFSVAVSRGTVEDFSIHNIVLSTLGLFYEVPWNGWVKVEDFLIERILGDHPKVRAIDPRDGPSWPTSMGQAYAAWPTAWLPPKATKSEEVFNRLTFMFGEPYLPQLLAPGIHGPLLFELFGGMHLGLYLQAGQMVRRGYAAKLNDLSVIDRSRLRNALAPAGVVGDLDPTHFQDKKITLVGGAQNQLWHRDSVDLMHEWLLERCPHTRPTKHIFEGHAHQDLLWGREAADRGGVYETIEAGL